MRSQISLAVGLVALLAAGVFVVAAEHRQTNVKLEPGDSIHVVCNGKWLEHDWNYDPGRWDAECVESGNTVPTPTPTSEAEPTATPTEEPTATPTEEPTATPTEAAQESGWHEPGSHDGLNVHEHGDAPPAWATGALTQNRESHTGYKGVYDVSPGGAESYLVAHIISTEGARSHGDHDYQLYVRDPESGHVFMWDGVLCFAEPCTAPAPERTSDTGERPIILGERSSTDGCETWYSDPGEKVVDVGWTICGRYQAFDGTVLGGVGTFRTIDWIIPCNRLTTEQFAALGDNCRTEFGVSRLSFIVNSRDYSAPGITPIN